MRRHLLVFALAAVAACSPLSSIPPAPASVADTVQLDETAASTVELAYKAARTACELAVDLGLIKGERATAYRALNRKAYAAVLATRTAYRAGNSADYVTAAREARSLVDQLLALTGRA